MKIGIVGAGSVGATIAYSIAVRGLASEIAIVDKVVDKAEGEVLDLAHCAAFIPPVKLRSGDLDTCRDMDVVVVTAGIKRRVGELRTDLVRRNMDLCRIITEPLAKSNKAAIFIIVSNPVDLLALYIQKHSGLPAKHIIGSGTLLDTSRFRHLLSMAFSIDPHNVHGYIIGEHGAGSVPLWSQTQIGSVHVDDFAAQADMAFGPPEKQEIFDRVLDAGQRVIQKKGATFYGIAQTVLRILTAISRDEERILTVSVETNGFAGVQDLSLSLPVTIGRNGVGRIIEPQLNDDEMEAFRKAADSLKAVAKESDII